MAKILILTIQVNSLRDSVQSPIKILADQFKAMKIRDQVVDFAFAASEDQIKNALNFVQFSELSKDSEKRCPLKLSIMKEHQKCLTCFTVIVLSAISICCRKSITADQLTDRKVSACGE